MPSREQVYDEWTKTYMQVLSRGYRALPDEIRKMPMEEQAAILRGMMVEASRDGLLSTAKEVMDMLGQEPCPDFRRADEPARPDACAASSAQPPAPAAAGKRDLRGHEGRDGKVRMASDAQVGAILRWADRDGRYREVVRDYLRARDLLEPGDLTLAEASDLLDTLATKAGLKPPRASPPAPQGAKA